MTLQAVDALGADSAPTAILDRVSLVLDAFDGPGRLTLAQVVRSTGLPRSSAHRMLERLVSMRWLRRDGRDYELGMRLVELGSLAVHQDRLHAAAMPLLHELYRVTGFVVHLGILDGPDVVYMEKIGGRLAAAVPDRSQWSRRGVDHRHASALRSVRHCSRSVRRSPRATHCPTSPESASPGWPSNPETAYRDSAVLRHRSAPSAAPSPRYPSARRRRPSASTTSAQRRSVWRPLPFGEASTADR